ncbi:hypothetical protein BGW42_007348 [Actinomortierella wolfii]|nr:hypothetical protein BGW42_007348 [Actinomortierella wolfii]
MLTSEALDFLALLHRTFNSSRLSLLLRRHQRQTALDSGEAPLPDFLDETRAIREDITWQCAPLAPGLVDRRVEIVASAADPDRVVRAMNAGAKVYMADFEDSNAPTWANVIQGQMNLKKAIDGRLDGIQYQVRASPGSHSTDLRKRILPSTVAIRPRGWHLDEKHVLVDGTPISASLFDFGLYFFHNAHKTREIDQGPYFYLPKLESYLEARLWNDVFNLAQDVMALPRGTIRATVLIETLHAAFEMEEILFELRSHSSGLLCGRWDYLFSLAKTLKNNPNFVLPNIHLSSGTLPEGAASADHNIATVSKMLSSSNSSASLNVLSAPFMQAYEALLIHTCHRRGVHAVSGTTCAFFSAGNNNEAARQYKVRECTLGFDGTRVTDVNQVEIALNVFETHLPHRHLPHQLFCLQNSDQKRTPISGAALLDMSSSFSLSTPSSTASASTSSTNTIHTIVARTKLAKVTEQTIRAHLRTALLYIEALLHGQSSVAVDVSAYVSTPSVADTPKAPPVRHSVVQIHDLALAEMARALLWQWAHHRVLTDQGLPVTEAWLIELLDQEAERLLVACSSSSSSPTSFSTRTTASTLERAKHYLKRLISGREYSDFLIELVYDDLVLAQNKARI